ncbi:ATP-grasp domain-containing protein [Tissierella sp. Yu-01]|uniref:D-alanine--D-alanine ligase family protein n=1 Tax=Tissierella sp. Yu-01 TaxID=3035694 RepID=UPI00240DB9C7|nr:ATP-grasp domain-containing protein [Tissierella sp. Yu-01]WFA08101.1 ATP-grasp domain-containing protein [Tissierella sp. Yu-01]
MLHVGLLYTKMETSNKNMEELNPHGAIQMNVTVKAIEKALFSKGHKVTLFPATFDLLQRISRIKDLDVIFNACTGITNKRQQANVVAMLELQHIPFVGSSLSTQILGLHKQISKRLFRSANIPTPQFQVFYTGEEEIEKHLRYPLIVKPEHEGSSLGISNDSVVFNEDSLKKKVKEIIGIFDQPALVEEFVSGREFTVGVLGNDDPEVLPILEILYDDKNKDGLMTVDIKAKDAVGIVCPAEIDVEIAEKIRDYAKRAYKALGCNEYARIDVRLDENNIPNFIEINTLPGMQPNYSDFPRMAKVAGYTYEDLIDKMVRLAIEKSRVDNEKKEEFYVGATS